MRWELTRPCGPGRRPSRPLSSPLLGLADLFEHVGDLDLQVRDVGRVAEAGLDRDRAGADQLLDLAVEVLHPIVGADFHGVEQRLAVSFALLDVVARAQRALEDLEERDPAGAILPGHQPLRDDVLKRLCKPGADATLVA